MLVLAAASFTLFGALLVLVGSTHAEISAALGLSLARVNLLGASLSLGLALGLLVGGPVVDRFPRRPVYQCALAISGASLLAMTAETGFATAVFLVAAAGFGAGAYETVLNATVIGRYRERSTRPIAVLHAAATVGAVVAPGLIGWLLIDRQWPLVFEVAGFAHLALLVASFAVDFGSTERDIERGSSSTAIAAEPARFASPLLVFLCLVGFAYVGLETALTLLAVPYATEALGLTPDAGRTAISAFWLGLLAGRVALFVVGRNAGPLTLSLVGLSGAIVLGLGVATALPQFAVLVFATGLSLGCVFPLLISLSGQLFETQRGTAVGFVAGVASIGGFAVPAATGYVGDALGVRAAMSSLVLGCLVIAVAGRLAHTASKRRAGSGKAR